MLQLTSGDKAYIKLYTDGVKPSTAFREAYPDHNAVRFWHLTRTGTKEEKQKAAEVLKSAAQLKLRTKHIKSAMTTYQDKMEQYSELSLETATELVQNARSEKVRADLAIEGIRHKIGTPVQKVALQEKKVVILQFGSPPDGLSHPPDALASPDGLPSDSRNVDDVLEGQVVDDV